MTRELTYSSQSVVLNYNSEMRQSYYLKDQKIRDHVVLAKGTNVDVWRFDYNDDKYLLINNEEGWHWISLPLK